MKKIIIIVLFFSSLTFAQKEFGNPTDYDSTTAMSDVSTFMVRHNGVTKTLTWWRLNQLLNASSGNNLLPLDNNWTGWNNFSGGRLSLPSAQVSPYHNNEIWYDPSDSTFHAYVKDASNNKFVIALATQHYHNTRGSGSGAGDVMDLSTNQNVDGIKTWQNGGTRYTGTSDNYLHLYNLGSAPSQFYDGKIYGNYTDNYFRIKVQHTIPGDVEKTAEIPETREVQAMIDSLVKVNYAVLTDPDTLDWGGKEFIWELNTPQSGSKTYYFKNYGPGQYTLYIYTQEDLNLDFEITGATIKWGVGGKPIFNGRYTVNFTAIDAGLCLAIATKFED